jgi:hypothetical protein
MLDPPLGLAGPVSSQDTDSPVRCDCEPPQIQTVHGKSRLPLLGEIVSLTMPALPSSSILCPLLVGKAHNQPRLVGISVAMVIYS